MKKIIVPLLLLMSVATYSQNADSIKFKISIDSCISKGKLINAESKVFYLTVKNTSDILTLFKNDNVEVGIKIYVNKIAEDDQGIVIVKHLFMEKKDDEWQPITSGEYYNLENLGNPRSIKIGSNQDIPDFFIEYKISAVEESGEKKTKGILDLIPALRSKQN